MRSARRYLVSLLYAPGIIVHELAHLIACLLCNVRVSRVVLFRFGDPPGYVEHDVPRSYTKRIVITIAPLVVNTVAGAGLIYLSARVSILLGVVLVGTASSLIASSVPSDIDAKALIPHSTLGMFHPLFVVSIPGILILLVVNWLRQYGFHLLYTACLIGAFFVLFHTNWVQPLFSDGLMGFP